METRGRLTGITRAWGSGELILTFQCDEVSPEALENLQGKTLRIKAVQWREKRSLDANAYSWVLCAEIASAMNTSKDEVYEMMLQDYGTVDTFEDGTPITITVLKKVDISILDGHYKRYRESKDGKFVSYIKLKGSSEMDSKEMSHFIDGIISEAKSLGIDTITPKEKERMLNLEKG